MKRAATVILAILLAVPAFSIGESTEAGDSLSVSSRAVERVFMPKGDFSVGAQFFYLDLASSNSELMLLLQNLDARGSMLSVSPYIEYTYRDNRAVGLRTKFSYAEGGVSSMDIPIISEELGMEVSLGDIDASSRTIQADVFLRSYAPIDRKGRFGVFTDLSLAYSRTGTRFAYNAETLDTHSNTHKLRLSVHPGLMIFVMNNLSTHVSIGIGGATYTHVDYIKGDAVDGTRDFSKVNFMLDILDISYGLSLHF